MNDMYEGALSGRAARVRTGVSNKMIRVLIVLPLMLCALLGFVVSLPLWLASRIMGDRSY